MLERLRQIEQSLSLEASVAAEDETTAHVEKKTIARGYYSLVIGGRDDHFSSRRRRMDIDMLQ